MFTISCAMGRKKSGQGALTITIKEAASLLGVSEPTLRRWDRLGKLQARRHPVNGYRLYERGLVLAMRSRIGRLRLIEVPNDFPNFTGDRDIAIVDTLIFMLFGDRDLLDNPVWRPTALARIERARSAIIPFGRAPTARSVRLELMVTALDRSVKVDAPLELRVQFVQILVGEAMPDAKLDDEVIRDAVRLWPEKRQTEDRTRAVRELARALRCDVPSLMTMLRAARKRVRERIRDARRK
jgi:excisionase family DNA binding protein